MTPTRTPRTPTRKRRGKKNPPLGATTYRGRDQNGADLFPPQPAAGVLNPAGLALVRTQDYAQNTPEPDTYYVERQTLFGTPVDLFAVERDEGGVIRTFTLTKED